VDGSTGWLSKRRYDAGGGKIDGNNTSNKRRRSFVVNFLSWTTPEIELTAGGDAPPNLASALFSTTVEAEWESYLRCFVGTLPGDTALSWWRAHEQAFPRVAKGARYLNSVLATSVSPERVFSRAGHVVTQKRARLTGANAENYMVLSDGLGRSRQPSVSGGGLGE